MNFKHITIILSLFAGIILAQEGDFYLTHYTPENEQIENENFAIVQDKFGQMLFANSRGVLKFDGRYWNLINTPSTALSLATDSKSENIFIGCLNGFGYLEYLNGEYFYRSIFQVTDDIVSISKVLVVNNIVYFIGDGCIYVYDSKSNKIISKFINTPQYDILKFFKIDAKLYMVDTKHQYYEFKNNSFMPISGLFPVNESVVYSEDLGDGSSIFATDANKLYKLKNSTSTQINLQDQSYITNSIINDAIYLKDNRLILSTNKGGCVLVDISSGKTISIINYYSGLPDDEVFAIGKDGQSGIWIAHEYGFSRLDYYLPFKCYSTYPGLEGHVEAAVTHLGKIHVATSEGVYVLSKVNNFQEIKYIIKEKKKKESSNEENKEGKLNSYVKDQKSKFERLKNFFGIKSKENETKKTEEIKKDSTRKEKKKLWDIFKKKKGEDPITQPNEKVTSNSEPNKPKYKTEKVKVQTRTIITTVTGSTTSVKFYFKKIKGIDAKCRQLITFGDKLLVSSNNGIFEISDKENYQISSLPISYLYVSKNKAKLFAGVDGGRMASYKNVNGTWEENPILPYFQDNVNYIAEDASNNLWISCINRIYRITFDNDQNTVLKIDTIKINNPFSDDVHLAYSGGKMYFVVSNKVYSFNEKNNLLVNDSTTALTSGNYLRLLHSENNILWYNNGKNWNYLSDVVTQNKNFVYLRLFKDIQDIFIDNDNKHCWVITKGSNLYFFDMSNQTEMQYSYNVFLRNIKSEKNNMITDARIVLEEDHTKISFNFINPQYLDNSQLEFQYKLEGLDDKWSEWGRDNEFNFNSLPTGKFRLIVRTRNALDQVTESTPIEIRVNPPYWKEWWFFLLEAVFFGTLLLISYILNRTGKGNATVSKVLTFITLVLMVEFLNAIADNILIIEGSPVNSFLVHVLIALLLFPFERLLHGIITNSIEAKKINLRIKRAAKRVQNKSGEKDEEVQS